MFVSHSGEDTWVAKQIAYRIGRCGAKAFLDDLYIQGGADFEKDIRGFLKKADELLVLLTPWALERPYVWAELGAAWTRGIPIIVLLHGLTAAELEGKAGIPVFLKAKNWRKLNDADRYFTELRKRVDRVRGPGVA